MMDSRNKSIVKNSFMLYFRQIFMLLIGLYTVRVLLNVLGVENYGVYSVLFGIVSLFSFLGSTIISAMQRFISFYLGHNSIDKLKKIFSSSLLICFIIAIVAFILLETLGLWFVNEQLKLPLDRFGAARITYQFIIFSFIASILISPFMAVVLAHEDMHIYAYISMAEALMKLGITICLIFLSGDKLELYGILIFIVSIISAIFYISVCINKYAECRLKRFYHDLSLFKDIVGFTFWTMFGQISSVIRNQAVTILLNQTFNPVVVTARVIANSIAEQIHIFSYNFNISLYPSIVKSYATNDRDRTHSLVLNGSKITFFLMWIFTLPFLWEMDNILLFWLKNPPTETVFFARLALIELLIVSFGSPLASTARAVGKMKMYELILGFMQIAIFIISWIVLAMGKEAYSVFVVAIIVSIIMFIARLLIVRGLINISLRLFWNKVIMPVLLIVVLSIVFSFVVNVFLPQGIIFTSLSIILDILISGGLIYFWGMDKNEKINFGNIIKNEISKKH